MSKLRNLGLNVLVAVASLAVFFGLVEGLARLSGYAPPPAQADVFNQAFVETGHAENDLFVPHPSRIWSLRPGFVGQRDDWGARSWITINAQGRRGTAVPLKKPAGTYRIALLGDSVAFGSGVQVKDIFAAQLEWNLNALAAHKHDEGMMFVDDYHLTEGGHSVTAIEILEQLEAQGVLVPQ
jgi:hypothetical protein